MSEKMEDTLLQLFEQAGWLAVFISIFVSIVVSIAGVLPSVFVTIANLLFFGLVNGLVVSILGEAFGAIISFMLYRKGLKKWRETRLQTVSKRKKRRKQTFLRTKNSQNRNLQALF